MATRLLLRQRTQPHGGRGVYIYLYSHPQMRLFRSIRTHQYGKIRRTPGSKPIQTYVQLSLRPLGQYIYI